jgi:predicted ester cyclase
MDAAVMRTSSSAVLVEHHFAALVTGDAALAARCIHPSHVNHMAANEPPACAAPGVPGFVATSAWLRHAFGDLSFEIIELTADADRTMAHVRMSGRQTGPFVVFPPGVRPVVFAPTGLAFGVRQVHVFRDAIRVSAEAAAAGDAGADAVEWHPQYTAWCGLTALPGGPASQQAERQSLTGG